jgi:hypothetical protein
LDDNIITLYHGSIYDFDRVDVTAGKPFKDFGVGFYLSQSEEHAVRLTLRNKHIEERRLKKHGRTQTIAPWLYIYEFNLQELDNLSVKNFVSADREWAEFIVKNRLSDKREHNYDVIIGPTANDNTNATVDLFMMGTYGNPDSDFAIETFLQLILPEALPRQMYFGSQQAADLLTLKDRRSIW